MLLLFGLGLGFFVLFCFLFLFPLITHSCFFCNRLLENRRSSKSSGRSSERCYHLISVVSNFKCLMCVWKDGWQTWSLVVDGRTYPCMMCESCVQSPAPLVGHTGVALKCLWSFHSTGSRQLSSVRRWHFQIQLYCRWHCSFTGRLIIFTWYVIWCSLPSVKAM